MSSLSLPEYDGRGLDGGGAVAVQAVWGGVDLPPPSQAA